MKTLRSVMVIAAFTLSAFTTAAPQGKKKTLTGKVSDAACGAEHKMKNMSAADCARARDKKASYALVAGDTVYELNGQDEDFHKYTAENGPGTGALDRETI